MRGYQKDNGNWKSDTKNGRIFYCVSVSSVNKEIYKGILEANGKPNKEWVRVEGDNEDAKFICLEYKDGRVFGFWINMAGRLEFCNVEITGSEYRFGKKNIGIGTEKKVIEQAYKNSYINLFDNEKNCYYAEDGKCGVTFYFDEEDKVNRIIISEPPVYHEMSGWMKEEVDM